MRAAPVAGLVLALMAGGPLTAQENGTVYRDWTLACRAAAVGETDCALSQVLVTAGGNELVAEISLAPDEAAVVMVMRVPTGVVLRQPALARVVGQPAVIVLDWLTCDARYCTAAQTLKDEALAALLAGLRARLGYQRMGTETPSVFDVSLLGVTAGLRALGAVDQ